MKKLALIVLLLLPASALAASFANQAVFLSRSPVVEGSTVRIYAVVDNESSVTFSGSVVMSDGSAKVGSVPVSMAPGAAQTVSLPWTPTAGKHTISAQLIDQSGNIAETQTAAFSIDPKPQPAATSTVPNSAAVESSSQLQQQIGQYSPQAETISKPVFSTLDSLRNVIANGLSGQLAQARSKLANSAGPQSSGSAGGFSVPNTANDFWWVLWTIYSYLLQALLYIVSNVALFYPLFVLAVFYLLFKTYKWARRPSY